MRFGKHPALPGSGVSYAFIRALQPAAWFSADRGVTVTGQGVSTLADQSGNGRDLLQGTDASRPPYLSYSGTKYLYLPGVSGNYADTPDSAGNSITGDIDIRWYGSLTDWTPATFVSLVSNWVGADANSAYDFGVNATGTLSFVHVNGTTQTIVNSSAGTSITDGADSWVRVTWKQSTGATNFYKSSDGTTWTQVGTADVAGPTAAMNDSTRNLAIGATVGGTANFISGRIYRAIIKNGIDGTTVVDFNPNLDASDASTSFASSATGETWTVNSSGGLPAQIVGRPSLLFDGSADYLKTNAFTLNQPETVYIAFKQVSWSFTDTFTDGNSATTMYIYQGATSPKIRMNAGTNTDENSNLPVGQYAVISAVFNGASSVLQVNQTATTGGNCGAANAGGFTLGGTAIGTACANIQVLEAIIFPTAHDATQRARVIQYLAGRHGVAL